MAIGVAYTSDFDRLIGTPYSNICFSFPNPLVNSRNFDRFSPRTRVISSPFASLQVACRISGKKNLRFHRLVAVFNYQLLNRIRSYKPLQLFNHGGLNQENSKSPLLLWSCPTLNSKDCRVVVVGVKLSSSSIFCKKSELLWRAIVLTMMRTGVISSIIMHIC